MSATTPRLPLLKHVRPLVWPVLSWCGALAYPVVLFVAVVNGRQGFTVPLLLLPAVLTVLIVSLLRSRPLPALALLLAGSVAVITAMNRWEIGYLQVLITVLAVGFIAATRSRRTSVTAAVMALVVQAGAAGYYTYQNDFYVRTITFIAFAMAAAWVAGDSVRERREHAQALHAQTTARAVADERLRIARELHDMVAHSIGIIAIQAGVGSRVIDTQPQEARNALSAIETTSRETLSGLRRMLGALRQAEPESAPREPAPGLADLDRLAEKTTDAGVRVDVHWSGKRRPLPPDIELSAFRIVQEAVTNVVRHADTGHCRVSVDYQDEELSLEIVDDGRGRVAAGPGVGYGIAGMRERAGLLHGHFTAGPRLEGGFRVAARLPVPEGVR
ncbi:sensor histidine kinase [Streptomyces sannanensis]|uniref:histidine kinase n=1 Tax=Streptomyces sannanensis TaxID=285536 RepID=A0ABP6S5T3_9ACTN